MRINSGTAKCLPDDLVRARRLAEFGINRLLIKGGLQHFRQLMKVLENPAEPNHIVAQPLASHAAKNQAVYVGVSAAPQRRPLLRRPANWLTS